MRVPWPVKQPVLAVYRTAIRVNLALCRNKYRFVFLLGHMRSGSSLLSHIIASHPEFVGAGETFVTYRSPNDLQELVSRTCEWLHKLNISAPYIVDQINHNHLVTEEMLRSPLIHNCIIIIRSPEPTLQSMLSTFGSQFGWDEKWVLNYYVDRLDALARYGMILGSRALVVEYDELVDHNENTLAKLSKFIGVKQPLKPYYSTRRTTGSSGDPSQNILAGQIVRTKAHECSIDVEAFTQASFAFQACRQKLLSAGVQTINEIATPHGAF